MSKLEAIAEVFQRDRDLALPRTSDRKMKQAKGSTDFIRHQFITSVVDYLDKNSDLSPSEMQSKNPKKFNQILKKVYEKYQEVVEEIVDHMDDTEERITRMAKEDYIYKKAEYRDDDDEDWDEEEAIENVDWYDVQDIIAEFIPEEFHHNIKGRYPWVSDYFPQSIDPSTIKGNEPWGTFMSRYVDPIVKELEDIYSDFVNVDKKLKDNINKNKQNLFDFIFSDSDHLQWDWIRS